MNYKKYIPFLAILFIGAVIGWIIKPCPSIGGTVETIEVDTTRILDMYRTELVKYNYIDSVVYSKKDSVMPILVYDTIRHKNNYYTQHFQIDSSSITTFGGFVDSLQAQIHEKEIIIKDSIVEKIYIDKVITRDNYITKDQFFIGGGLGYTFKDKETYPILGVGYTHKNFHFSLDGGYLPKANSGQIEFTFKYNVKK